MKPVYLKIKNFLGTTLHVHGGREIPTGIGTPVYGTRGYKETFITELQDEPGFVD